MPIYSVLALGNDMVIAMEMKRTMTTTNTTMVE